MRRLLAACLATSAALTGCGTNSASDPLQVTDRLAAATPVPSPPAAHPAGTVLPAAPAEHAVFDAATSTLAVTCGNTITLYNTAALADQPRTITLAAPAASLHTTRAGGSLLAAIPSRDLVTTVDLRTGTTSDIPVPGGPADAAETGTELAVALSASRTVVFLRDGKITRTTSGFAGPAQLIPHDGEVLVLDRLTTALTPIDLRTAGKGAGLRAGDGATNATADRFGRVLVTDTRGGELLAFSTSPLIMKQRYPVQRAPYAIAYDPRRDLAWVTLTDRNEVVGYDVAGGEPVERHRLPTVRQPNAVAVNPASGDVFVASATGEGIQVVKV